MKQTPAHNVVNNELLAFMPTDCRRVIEIGCMHGALAKAYCQHNPSVEYTGVDIDPDYADIAAEFCTRALSGDIELLPESVFDSFFPSDCWVFGDCLEHLRDPWKLLKRIRDRIDPGGGDRDVFAIAQKTAKKSLGHYVCTCRLLKFP